MRPVRNANVWFAHFLCVIPLLFLRVCGVCGLHPQGPATFIFNYFLFYILLEGGSPGKRGQENGMKRMGPVRMANAWVRLFLCALTYIIVRICGVCSLPPQGPATFIFNAFLFNVLVQGAGGTVPRKSAFFFADFLPTFFFFNQYFFLSFFLFRFLFFWKIVLPTVLPTFFFFPTSTLL